MINITMDVFSGKQNPNWELTKAECEELLGRVIDGGLEVLPPEVDIPLLGYRGFKVNAEGKESNQLQEAGAPTTFTVSSVRQDATDLEAETEASLISDGNAEISDTVAEHSLDRVTEIADEQTDLALPKTPSWGGSYAPDYGYEDIRTGDTDMSDDDYTPRGSRLVRGTSNSDFSFWNRNPFHQRKNNCYNFGSNWRTSTFAQPGRGGFGEPFWKFDPTFKALNCVRACIADGLLPSNPCDGSAPYKLGVVAWPGQDFHFYRRVSDDDSGERWAHKAGQTRARNTDNAGELLRDPETADRGGYTDWGGYIYRTRNSGAPGLI